MSNDTALESLVDERVDDTPKKSQLKSAIAIVALALLARLYLAFVDYARTDWYWRQPIQLTEWIALIAILVAASYTFGRFGRHYFNRPISFLLAVLGGGLATAHCDNYGAIFGGLFSLPVALTVVFRADLAVIRFLIRSVIAGVIIAASTRIFLLQFIGPRPAVWLGMILVAATISVVMLWRLSHHLERNPPRRSWLRTGFLFVFLLLLVGLVHTYTKNGMRSVMLNRMAKANLHGRINFPRRTRIWRFLGQIQLSGLVSYRAPVAANAFDAVAYFPEIWMVAISDSPEVTDDELKVLSRAANLTELSLKNTGATNGVFRHLPRRLTKLEMTGLAINDDGVRHLAKMNNLSELLIDRWNCSDESLAQLLTANRGLSRLQLDYARVGPKTIVALSKLQFLDRLSLRNCQLTDDDLLVVSKLNPSVLDLSATPVTDEGLALLATSKRLSILKLNDRQVSIADLAELAKIRSLIQLELKNAGVNDDALSSISKMTRLNVLNVRGNKITDRGVPQLTKMLSLQSLNISKNDVGRSLGTLKALPTLLELDVSETLIQQEQVQMLSGRIMKLRLPRRFAGDDVLSKGR